MFSFDYALPRIKKKNTGCWEWIAFRNANNYGIATVGSKTDGTHKQILAHRMLYALTYGDFDSKLCVLHKCDNPPCVNPEHLFLGTMTDNMKDMRNKGRFYSKLSAKQVREIRKKLESKARGVDLAREYGVKPCQIGAIKFRRQWRDI